VITLRKKASVLALLFSLLLLAIGFVRSLAGPSSPGMPAETVPALAPEYPEGEYLRFDAFISDTLPEMTFEFVKQGESGPSYEPLYAYDVKVYEKKRPEHLVQAFACTSYEKLDILPFVALFDLNFDGFLDLDILSYQAASNQVHTFFLWDAQNDRYVETELIGLEASSYLLFPERKMIEGYRHDSAAAGEYALYAWKEGRLSLVRRLAVGYLDEGGETPHTMALYSCQDGKEALLREESYTEEEFSVVAQAFADMLWEGIEGGRPKQAP